MKILKPKALIIFGFVLSSLGYLIIMYVRPSQNFLYLRLNALCGLVPVIIGIILSIRNDRKDNKKVHWIKTASLAYFSFAFVAIIISFLLGR